MKTGKRMIHILLSILLLLWIAMSVSVYIRFTPPESIVLAALRIPYQMFSNYLTITGVLGTAIYAAVILIKRLKPEKYSLVLVAGVCICCILGCVYSVRIMTQKAQISRIQYGEYEIRKTQHKVTRQDLHEKLNVTQCSVSTPEGSPYASDGVVYLNYGGWSAQDEQMGTYLEKMVTNIGYSYVRFVGIGKEQGNISDIAKSVKEGIRELVSEQQYKKVVLIGGSAGGHIAFITAFANELPDIYGERLPVDGVIALYPMTDMESAYDYFVDRAKETSFLGELGSQLYCGLYGNASGTGTFAGETKSLDETVFGVKSDEDSFYKEASVLNLVGNQNIPTLMIGGSADSMVVVEDNRKLYHYMKDHGMDCAYLELPNVEHAFDMTDNSARKRACIEMKKWLGTVFGDKG